MIKELRCMCFSFCVGVCGPNISDILITCRIENAASERNALWSCEECPIQVLSGTICVSLKMWAPWTALFLRENLASHTLPNSGYVVWGVFPAALPCGPLRGWPTRAASSILGMRTCCLLKQAKSQLLKQDFQIKVDRDLLH